MKFFIKKNGDVKTRHISNIQYSPMYGESCIQAFCHEASKELSFNISKVLSIQEYWIGITSNDVSAPKDGLYLVASVELGQGLDICYDLLELKEGDTFICRKDCCAKPIAYHYVPSYGDTEDNWTKKEITIRKWENEIILAPHKGIPIIAYCGPQKENLSKYPAPIEYCNDVREVQKNDDISTWFKEWDNAGPFGWSECWDGYRILGFIVVYEYDDFACQRHVEQRIKMDHMFLYK